MHHHSTAPPGFLVVVLSTPVVLAALLYGVGVTLQHRRGTRWAAHRTVAWFAGLTVAAAGCVAPLVGAHDFVAHMWSHLLVGMVAPLLLVVAAPASLALRSLHVRRARQLSRVLGSWPVRIVTFPVVAALLNVGALWVLYLTPLYEATGRDPLLHVAVMAHVLIAGVIFTAAILRIDPAPHGGGFALRMAVLLAALAAHGILAKIVFAHPPVGVSAAEAVDGALLMYYGGDVVDAALLTILCAQWYRRRGRRMRRQSERAVERAAAPTAARTAERTTGPGHAAGHALGHAAGHALRPVAEIGPPA